MVLAGFVGGFVGGFGWFWLVPCFSNYGLFDYCYTMKLRSSQIVEKMHEWMNSSFIIILLPLSCPTC